LKGQHHTHTRQQANLVESCNNQMLSGEAGINLGPFKENNTLLVSEAQKKYIDKNNHFLNFNFNFYFIFIFFQNLLLIVKLKNNC